MTINLRFRLLVSAFALVWLGTACPAEDDPSTGDSGSGDASTGGETGTTAMDASASTGSEGGTADSTDGDAACECVEASADFVELACDVDELCEPVVVGCSHEPLTACELPDLVVLEPEDLECHRAALTAGAAGLLRWELPYAADPGAEGQRFMLVMTGDGTATAWHESWGAPTYAISDVVTGPLRAATHFDACMDLPTLDEAFRCLFDATEAVSAVCVPAHQFPIG
jgi:hypothetical protein